MVNNWDIVYISAIDWDFLWERPQQLMSRLARDGKKILFIQPPVTPRRFPKIFNNFYSPQKNIYIYTPIGLSILKNKSLFSAQHYFIPTIKRLLRKLNFNHFVLFLVRPEGVDLLGCLEEKLVCYDCLDDFASFPGTDRTFIEHKELTLLKKADVVFVTSKGLYNKCFSNNPKTFLLPNAADIEHFTISFSEQKIIPYELNRLPRPLIGYTGCIYEWFDFELLEYLSKTHPEWSIIIIGPVSPGVKNKVKRVSKITSIHFLGKKDYSVLPAYISSFDVCIMPFKLNKIIENTNPVKVYEYLAMGKPVVSVKFAEMDAFGTFVKQAKNNQEFENCIVDSLKDNRENKLIQERINFAKQNSWDARVNQINHLISEILIGH